MEPLTTLRSTPANHGQPSIGFAQRLLNRQIQDEKEFIETCRHLYTEITMYKGEVLGSPESSHFQGTEGDKERMRTELSLLCLFWILKSDYHAFTECQPAESKLKPETFDKVVQKIRGFLNTPERIHAMLVVMSIHDLGKCVWFSEEVYRKSNHLTNDHDVVLRDALECCPELLPSYAALPAEDRQLIKDAWDTGLNTGQFVQAECLPFHLVKALEMTQRNPECMNFFFCHELLDVAGVMGHEEPRGSKILTEASLKSFQFAWEALSNPQNKTAEAIYKDYLWHRGPYFGFDEHTVQVAARRLLCLSRLDGYKREDFRACSAAMFSVDSATVINFIKEMNESGLKGQKGILIYYAPHLMANLFKHFSKTEALHIGIELLNSIFKEARKLPENTPGDGSITVNVRPLCESLAKDPGCIRKPIIIDPSKKMVHFSLN